MRRAGFDGLWIVGRADEPVFICIQDKHVEIRSARHLWGLETYQTQAAIAAEIDQSKKPSIAVIGPAGEALIQFASILCDHGRVAGRTGMGALMGSKLLKAIAVQGTGDVPIANLEKYKPLRSDANRKLRNDAMTLMLRELGTAGPAEYFDYIGEMPKRYFHQSEMGEQIKTTGSIIKDTILTGVSACHACVIACGRVVQLDDGKKHKGPEYETLIGFGPNLLINDPIEITRLGELCDRLGVDTISMSNILGLAYRLFEKNIIRLADTGGMELEWGEFRFLERLIEMTVKREGFGALLAEGSLKFSQQVGAEAEAVQVKGLEIPYHDPRGASGMALVYATSPRGGCHNQSDYFLVDLGQVEPSIGMQMIDHHAGAEKSANVAIHQNWRTVFNSLVLCYFANLAPEMVLDLINSACGLNWNIEDLLKCGERGWNLKRQINHRFGLKKADDCLPGAFFIPYQDHLHHNPVSPPEFEKMLEQYYLARGWDPITGNPTQEKLIDLGLEFTL